MSSKSDRDNRANQLNPNNEAYYSSRGTPRSDAEDDGAWSGRGYGGPSLTAADLRALATIDPRPPRPENEWSLERRFFFDFVDLDGCTRHFEFTGRAVGSILDAQDVAEEGMRCLRNGLYPKRMPLAMWRVVDAETGKEHSWMSGRYQPGRALNWTEDTADARKALHDNDARWVSTGRPVVERVLEQWDTLERIDLGACTREELRIGNGGHAKLNAKIKQLTGLDCARGSVSEC